MENLFLLKTKKLASKKHICKTNDKLFKTNQTFLF